MRQYATFVTITSSKWQIGCLQINPLKLGNNQAVGANIARMSKREEMDRARILVLIKRVAAILLMACFFLPLSRCTVKSDPEARVVGSDTYLYGYVMAQDAVNNIQEDPFEGATTLAGLAIVFFIPAVCLGLKDRVQAPIYLLGSGVAAYFLFGWVFLFSTSVQIGGVIAVTCWTLLFCAACMGLHGVWRSRKRPKLP